MSAQQRGVLVSVAWENFSQIMEQLRPKTGNNLAIYFWFLSILLILCLPNASNISYHVTGAYKYYSKHSVVLVSVAYDNILSYHGAATA